jgi:hypothetical protein
MRSLRPLFIGVAAFVAPVLAIASIAGATPRIHPRPGHSSRKHAGPSNCQISMNVTPHTLTARDPAVIFGRLTCAGATSVAGRTVELFGRLGAAHGYSAVQSTTTDGGGFYEFAALPPVTASVPWFVRCDDVRSAAEQVKVAARVMLAGPPEGTQLLAGPTNRVTFTGSVDPNDAGYAVVLERQDGLTGGTWHRIDGHGTVGPEGRFSVTHTFSHPGFANLRVVVSNRGRANPHDVPSASNVLAYEISQAQNPRLTIAASADPIADGQSVTITGTLAAGAKKQVTLLAGLSGQKLSPVAKATTGGGGAFSFASQSPSASTVYRVKGGGTTSAAMDVGVRDVLTATVSATSVAAGQPLTFSGTVAPEHSGHVIYLERQNASGTGFHVIELGTVGMGSNYSIVHAAYDVGTHVFRISIPGGPENEGVASAPLSVEVKAAPASTLIPEAPENSGLPVGGQF